jgi:alpha-tubulin suppressor-like RCC1 family protein
MERIIVGTVGRAPVVSAALLGALLVSYPRAGAAAPPPEEGIPCTARDTAVIANSGRVFSNAGTLVDSFQSSAGPYGGVNVGSQGNVRAGLTIVNNGGVIRGTLTPNSPAGLAPVPVPAGAVNLPLDAPSPGDVNINGAAESLTLSPGNYVARNVNITAGGSINLAFPGPLYIWVTGTLNVGGTENAGGLPSNLQFLVTGTNPVSVNSGGRLFGFIYAPAAAVNVGSTIFGGVTGASVALNSGAQVHFDQSSSCVSARSVSVLADFGCAATTAGGAHCWGDNFQGELGNGTTIPSPIPVAVTGLTGVTAVATGGAEACAIASGGAAKCWGNNNGTGALGNGTTTNSPVPVQVTGLTSGVKSIAIAFETGCAVTAANALMCWGANSAGQLGNGTTNNSLVPIPVPGLGSGVTSVSIGANETCAVVSGAVKCWGFNPFGNLGNGTTNDSLVPVQVTGLTSGFTQVSVGILFACALNVNGTVMCWGDNASGQLGNSGSTGTCQGLPCSLVPLPVTGLAGVSAVTAGGDAACAIRTGGDLVCWGDNESGQLGNGTTTGSVAPVQVTGLASGVVSASMGIGFACAATASGSLACWGQNSAEGQLGNNTTAGSLVPVPVAGFR